MICFFFFFFKPNYQAIREHQTPDLNSKPRSLRLSTHLMPQPLTSTGHLLCWHKGEHRGLLSCVPVQAVAQLESQLRSPIGPKDNKQTNMWSQFICPFSSAKYEPAQRWGLLQSCLEGPSPVPQVKVGDTSVRTEGGRSGHSWAKKLKKKQAKAYHPLHVPTACSVLHRLILGHCLFLGT